MSGSNNVFIGVAIVANVLSVVGVVLCNKYIVENDGKLFLPVFVFISNAYVCLGYNFMIFLSFLHFAFTTLGSRVLLGLDVFTYVPAPMSAILPVSIVSYL